MHPSMRRTAALAAIAALAVAACSSSGASQTPAPAGPSATAPAGGTTVQVTLQEWAVVPAVASAAAGGVTFQVRNAGPEDVHEFVVLKTDLEPGSLPVDADGAVTESGTGIEVINEIEDIPVGETQDLTVTLAAGKYVLLCNIYSADEKEAHYKLGMRTAFTVN
jgi:uncharacterized cupredoxin-like copper-binding protein